MLHWLFVLLTFADLGSKSNFGEKIKKMKKKVTEKEFLVNLDGGREPRRVSIRSKESQRNSRGQIKSYTVNPPYRK